MLKITDIKKNHRSDLKLSKYKNIQRSIANLIYILTIYSKDN